MRKKLSPSYGTLGLALAASVFFGCQDFLGHDKDATAAARSGDEAKPAAQEDKDGAKDPTVQTADTGQFRTTTVPDPAEPGSRTTLCLQLRAELDSEQAITFKDTSYKLLAQYYADHGCPAVLKPDETLGACGQADWLLATLDPASPEYAAADAYRARHCVPAGPGSPPSSTPLGPLEECKYLQSEMQSKTATEAYYLEIKYKYIGKHCDQIIADANPPTPPPPPPDSATRCNNIRDMLAAMDPASPKYPYYQEVLATECAAAPAAPPAKTEPPEPTPPTAAGPLTPEQEECLDLYYQIQSGSGNYPLAKNQYGEKDCDRVLGDAKPAPPPWTPPTTEERCAMFRLNLTQTQPVSDPKWPSYVAEMEILCADYP